MNLDIDKIRMDGGTQPEKGVPFCAACQFGFAPILHQHHIRPSSEGGCNDKDNLVYLCPNCHALIHQIYKWGSSKNIKESFEKMGNFLILKNWIEENLGVITLGNLLDIANSRHDKKDNRHGIN